VIRVLARTARFPAFHKDYSRSEIELKAGTAVHPVRYFDAQRMLCSLEAKYPTIFTVVIPESDIIIKKAETDEEIATALSQLDVGEAIEVDEAEFEELVKKPLGKAPEPPPVAVLVRAPGGGPVDVPVPGMNIELLDEEKYGKRFKLATQQVKISPKRVMNLKSVQSFVDKFLAPAAKEDYAKLQYSMSSNPLPVLKELVEKYQRLANLNIQSKPDATPEQKKNMQKQVDFLNKLYHLIFTKAKDLTEESGGHGVYRLIDWNTKKTYDVDSRTEAFQEADRIIGREKALVGPDTVQFDGWLIKKTYNRETGEPTFVVFHPTKRTDEALSETFDSEDQAKEFIKNNRSEMMIRLFQPEGGAS